MLECTLPRKSYPFSLSVLEWTLPRKSYPFSLSVLECTLPRKSYPFSLSLLECTLSRKSYPSLALVINLTLAITPRVTHFEAVPSPFTLVLDAARDTLPLSLIALHLGGEVQLDVMSGLGYKILLDTPCCSIVRC